MFYGQAKWSSETINCVDPVTQEPCVPPVFCLPHIEIEGAPSITSPGSFQIRGDNLVVFDDDPPNQEPLTCGILMWSLAGRANSPLCGGTNYINAAINYRGLTETDFPEGAAAIGTCLGELTVTPVDGETLVKRVDLCRLCAIDEPFLPRAWAVRRRQQAA